jgi:hypothetical protein
VNALGSVLFSQVTFLPFRPFSDLSLSLVKYYFVLQGIFLVGAVHFKGYVLPKTIFTIIVFSIICGFIAYFFMSDIMNSEIEEAISATNILESKTIFTFWQFLVALFWWALAPVTWIITFLGLKEQEV